MGDCIRKRRRAFWGWFGALVVAVGLAHVPIVSAEVGMARWHYDRGVAWIYEAQPEKAAESFHRALAEDPDLQPAHNGLGKVLLEGGDLEGALRHFTEASSLRPRDPLGRSNRGLVLAQMGRWLEAEEEFEVALEWAPTNVDWWTNLGICRERSGNRRDAIGAYQAALALDANHRAAANNLAWLLATAPEPELRDGERSVALAEQNVAAGPSSSTLDTLAAALAEAGRFDDAVAVADRALNMLGSMSGGLEDGIKARRILFAQGRPFRHPLEISQTEIKTNIEANPGGDDATQSR